MKRFIILSAVMAITLATAWACGPWMRPNYYMFSAFNRNQMGLEELFMKITQGKVS